MFGGATRGGTPASGEDTDVAFHRGLCLDCRYPAPLLRFLEKEPKLAILDMQYRLPHQFQSTKMCGAAVDTRRGFKFVKSHLMFLDGHATYTQGDTWHDGMYYQQRYNRCDTGRAEIR